jgi:farnesyl diphosphate synthase
MSAADDTRQSRVLSFPDWMRASRRRWKRLCALPAAWRSDSRPSAPGDALCQPEWRQTGAPAARFCRRRTDRRPAPRLEVVASAVELIHSYSLVHDDLPCMDDDVLRRGRPTCHVEYDQATALLVGDSLQSLAFEMLAREDFGDSHRQLEMVRLLARASGSCGMAGGQAIDLESVGKNLNQPELELMHALKTGALIRAAVVLGGLCGKR